MKVPFSWLKEFVDIDVTAQELEEKLFSCVMPLSTTRPSIWWNMGLWVASESERNTRPGIRILMGGF